ncbi:tripartite motif-containing protein 16-like [Salminus brasiliensis]|uniref:tripartite motif-containing protein 16-like n=1 Tax=Salminus brasiliensis TaxID=930266 RepID=UPI003B82EC13
MAEAALTAPDSFSCPICLDLLKDPVAIPCGHSFCLGCIKDCWDQDDPKGVYSCPQCRQTFTPRPVLNKNSLIAEMVEKLKMTRLQAADAVPSPAAAPPAGSGGVECDVCTGVKHTAVKSCLVCLASYCEAHVQPHYQSPAFKKHKLVEASMNLQEKICSLHNKLLEIFCRTDQQVICYLCVMDEHCGHKTVSAAAERAEKQNKLGQNRETCKQTIEEKEEKVQELKEVMENLRRSAQAAVEDSEKIFTDLIQSMERRRSEVKELIRAQEKAELSQVEELLKNLEQEIADLRRRDSELEQLSHTEDPIQFLQDFQALPALPEETDLSSINMDPEFSVEFLKKMVLEMEQLNGFRELEVVQMSDVYTVQPADPKTREEFLRYSCELTLNHYMVARGLRLSEQNKKVDLILQQRLAIPQNWCQVLCSEPLSGRCYWEAEISGNVSTAVSYKDINMEGRVITKEFGTNAQSWSLEWVKSSLCFRYDNSETELSVHSCPSRIGVYVDHSAGLLSFYSVSDTMTLLHRVNTTFTQPLYAGFGMKSVSSSVQICDLEEFLPVYEFGDSSDDPDD